jgi:hypothetical protein
MHVALALRFGTESHISVKVGMVPKEAGIVPVRSLCCRNLHKKTIAKVHQSVRLCQLGAN